MVMFHRAFMGCSLPARMGDSVLLLGRGLRKGARHLDGAETGPEQNEGEEECKNPSGHTAHCSERGVSASSQPPDDPGQRSMQLNHF
jgi:hypothetical protein